MEMCFATFDGFQKLLPFQHVVPTSSSHMKSCNFYLLSFSVSCMSRTFFNPFWLWPSMAIYGPYKLGIHREQYVGNLVGLISQFFCMELRGPRRSLTGQETPPSWPEPLQNLPGALPKASAPFPELSLNFLNLSVTFNPTFLCGTFPEPSRNSLQEPCRMRPETVHNSWVKPDIDCILLLGKIEIKIKKLPRLTLEAIETSANI